MKNEIKNKMLNDEQANTVKQFIVASMRDVYVDGGSLPDANFEKAAGTIADKIIKNTQMALLQNNVFAKIVKLDKAKKLATSKRKIKIGKR